MLARFVRGFAEIAIVFSPAYFTALRIRVGMRTSSIKISSERSGPRSNMAQDQFLFWARKVVLAIIGLPAANLPAFAVLWRKRHKRIDRFLPTLAECQTKKVTDTPSTP
jgi:hypothetical protein